MTQRIREALFPEPFVLGVGWLFFLLIILLLPLYIHTAAADPFVLGKESIFEASVALLVGLTAGAAMLGRRFRFVVSPASGFIVLFLIWTALTILWSPAPQLAWEETQRLFMLVVAMFLFQNFVSRSRTRLIWAGYAVMFASLGIAVWVIAKDALAAFSPESVRVARTLGDWRDIVSSVALGNSGHVADFLAIGFFFWLALLTLATGRGTKAFAIGSLWLHAAALIVAWSVHSNLSVIIGLVMFLISLRHIIRKRKLQRQAMRWGVLLAGWLFVVAFYVIDQPLNPHASRYWSAQAAADYQAAGLPLPDEEFSGGIFSQAFSSPRWKTGGETRIVIWLTSLEMVRQRPWFGWGAGTFTYVYPMTNSGIVENNPDYAPYDGRWTNAAHNEPLQFWSETGIVGLFLLIIIAAVSIKRSWERLDFTSPGNAVVLAGGLAALVAQLVQMQMSFPLQLPVSALMFFLLIGVPWLLPRRGEGEEALLMPVERPYGPLELEVMMHNMARPSEISAGLNFPKPVAIGAAGLVFALCAFWSWEELRPLRADIEYSTVRAHKRGMDMGAAPKSASNCEALLPQLREVLEIWPQHVDARSAYQDLLLCAGEFDEVVEQTPIVLEKLNAVEVYARRAQAYAQLGKIRLSEQDWDVVFSRQPEYGRFYPGQFQSYIMRMMERSNGSGAPN